MRISLSLAAAALLFLSACGSAPTSGPGGTVAVTLTDNALALAAPSVSNGKVTFTIKNSGSVVHSVVVLKTNLAHDKIPADPSDASRVDERGSVATSGKITPGETKTITADLGAGKYVLVCNEPAHYILGMHAGLVVN